MRFYYGCKDQYLVRLSEVSLWVQGSKLSEVLLWVQGSMNSESRM